MSSSEEMYKKAWEAGDSAVDWENLPPKTARFFKRQIQAARPYIVQAVVEEQIADLEDHVSDALDGPTARAISAVRIEALRDLSQGIQ